MARPSTRRSRGSSTRTGVVSHRADVTVLECAKALAVLDGRAGVERDDILDAARLALGHRVPTDPFDASVGIDDRLLRRILDEVLDVAVGEETEKKRRARRGRGRRNGRARDAVPAIADVDAEVARVFSVEVRADKHERGAVGRRERSLVSLRRGKYSRHRLARRDDVDVAVDATLRAAAMRSAAPTSVFR